MTAAYVCHRRFYFQRENTQDNAFDMIYFARRVTQLATQGASNLRWEIYIMLDLLWYIR